MTQELINQYKIILENKIFDWENIGFGKKIVKAIDTNNDYLSEFLNSYDSAEEMVEVFDSLNEALINPNIEAENGTQTINILIYQNKVDFYTFDDGFVYRIPTNDFREIFEGWRDFLLSPPLQGPYTGKY